MIQSCRLCVAVLFLGISGCAAMSPKVVSEDQLSLELSGLFMRPFQPGPTTWITTRIVNNSEGTFDTRKIQVIDITNSITLYGGDFGFVSTGFSSDPVKSWPKDMESLQPGQTGYISVNIGTPVGPEIQMNITLEGPTGHRAFKSTVMNIEGVIPVNQLPDQ